MKKKNVEVVYIITKLELGGAQKVCLSLFNGLHDKGCNTHLISGTQGPLVNTVQNNTHVYLLNTLKREISLIAFWYEIKNFIQLITTLRTLKKQYPDILVHTHSTKAGIVGRWAAFFAGIRIRVHTIHGYGFHAYQAWPIWLIIYIIELITSFITTHFICVSLEDAKTGIRLFPRFEQKHSIIRAAVDWQQFYTPARIIRTHTTTPFIFGTIACFKPQKNLFDLLHAFKQVYHRNQRVRLEIIGDGIQRTSIIQWIKQHELDHVIILHGWQQLVVPIMQQWHAFVLSSLWEGLPCALVEARLLRLPIISYAVGGIPEIITHEQNGLLCSPKDKDALAHNMLRVMYEQTLYQKMQTYTDHLDDFDTSHMIQEHLHLYKKLRMSP